MNCSRTFKGKTINETTEVDVNDTAYRRFNRVELPRYTIAQRDALEDVMNGEVIFNIELDRPEIKTSQRWMGITLGI